MNTKKHIHSVITDPETKERYCSTCGECFDTEFDNDISLNENSSNIGTKSRLGTFDTAVPESGRHFNLLSKKELSRVKITNRINTLASEHRIIIEDYEIRNILFYISIFYENKQKDNHEPHIKDNIIKDFIYLILISNKKYSEGMRFTPNNNSFAVNNYKYVSISNDELKKIFQSNLMLYRWI